MTTNLLTVEEVKPLAETRIKGNTIYAEIWYPRSEPVKYVDIDLIDIRASAGIRVSYDFERDGWRIERPTVFKWECSDPVCDPKFVEVAFVNSWGPR